MSKDGAVLVFIVAWPAVSHACSSQATFINTQSWAIHELNYSCSNLIQFLTIFGLEEEAAAKTLGPSTCRNLVHFKLQHPVSLGYPFFSKHMSLGFPYRQLTSGSSKSPSVAWGWWPQRQELPVRARSCGLPGGCATWERCHSEGFCVEGSDLILMMHDCACSKCPNSTG